MPTTARPSSWSRTIPVPPNAHAALCTSTRACSWRVSPHEVPAARLEEHLAAEVPDHVHAALHLHRVPAVRDPDDHQELLCARRGDRGPRPAGIDKQAQPDHAAAVAYQSRLQSVPGVEMVTHNTWFNGIYQD